MGQPENFKAPLVPRQNDDDVSMGKALTGNREWEMATSGHVTGALGEQLTCEETCRSVIVC